MTAFTIAMKYWREILIGVLLVAIIGGWEYTKHHLINVGVAKEQTRVADSTLTVVAPKLARTDTLLVHDTVRVREAVDRVVTMRDTLLNHLTDTVLVKEYVTRADSAVHACSELLNDCAAFRAYATQKIAALESKQSAAPIIITKSCIAPSVVTGLLSAGAMYVLRR